MKKQHLDDALYEQRTLGRIRCVRKTIYIHPNAMLPVMFGATKKLVERASRRYAETARMGAFLGGEATQIRRCTTMTPLTERTANSFMSPLKDG